MKNAIGKRLVFDEVKSLPDGTSLIFRMCPNMLSENYYCIVEKQGDTLTSFDGKIRWVLTEEDNNNIFSLYEWKPKKEMSDLERLLSNILIYQMSGVLEEEFSVFISENPDLNSISELNEFLEEEMSYWEL